MTTEAKAVPTLKEPRFSQSVERGLALLPCFTPDKPELGIFEMAELTGMSRSTTHRYVITLVELGYLEQRRAGRKYRLGIKGIDLGIAALNSLAFRSPSRPHLEALRASTGYSVGLGVLDGLNVRYVDHLRSYRPGQSAAGPSIGPGVAVPAYCTSIGKALLAFLPDEDRERAILESKRERLTDRTITKKKPFRERLLTIAELGYATSNQEFYHRARSLAVPVRDSEDNAVAAVNLSVYDCALTMPEIVANFYPLVAATAEKISRTAGYSDQPDPQTE